MSTLSLTKLKTTALDWLPGLQVLTTARVLQQQAEWEYSMEASFIEVYNNALRDLLGGSQTPYINDASAIKHDSTGGHTTVQGVTKV